MKEEILKLAKQGLDNASIQAELGLSKKSFKGLLNIDNADGSYLVVATDLVQGYTAAKQTHA